jgi:hypothetical protein
VAGWRGKATAVGKTGSKWPLSFLEKSQNIDISHIKSELLFISFNCYPKSPFPRRIFHPSSMHPLPACLSFPFAGCAFAELFNISMQAIIEKMGEFYELRRLFVNIFWRKGGHLGPGCDSPRTDASASNFQRGDSHLNGTRPVIGRFVGVLQ